MVEKMKMQTKNMTIRNINKLQTLFPNCITEGLDDNGELIKSVNFDMLKQLLCTNKSGGGY